MTKTLSEIIHDNLVKEVKGRLTGEVLSHIKYDYGEMDLIRLENAGISEIYEIKGYDSLKHYNRAYKQLKRAWLFFNKEVNCIYVSKNSMGEYVAKRVFSKRYK